MKLVQKIKRRISWLYHKIQQGVDYYIFGKIANCKTKNAWNTLKLSYKGKTQKSKL